MCGVIIPLQTVGILYGRIMSNKKLTFTVPITEYGSSKYPHVPETRGPHFEKHNTDATARHCQATEDSPHAFLVPLVALSCPLRKPAFPVLVVRSRGGRTVHGVEGLVITKSALHMDSISITSIQQREQGRHLFDSVSLQNGGEDPPNHSDYSDLGVTN